MNDYDTARLCELLREDGYEPTDEAAEADVIVLNTCAIRHKAESRVLGVAAQYGALKRHRPGLVVAVAGCVAQREGKRLLERLPDVDLVFGPDNIGRAPALIEQVRSSRQRLSVTDFADPEGYAFLSADPRSEDVGVTALVTIQKGCDNHCAYCVVPAARGREVSRPLAEVVAEVTTFVRAGAREVTLIGQNVNSYRGDGGEGFAELLAAVATVPGLCRVRFTTSHPRDFSESVARAMRDVPTVQPWLHLPVQAGSSRVLAAMRRGYDRETYLGKVDLVRSLIPEVVLTTDVIVGFPGESHEDFRETLSLLRAVRFESIYSFAYSARPRTPAVAWPDDVTPEEKQVRLRQVQALQAEITSSCLHQRVGRVTEVLVEGESRRGREACGRTPGNHVVNFPPPSSASVAALRGRELPVRITEAGTHTLRGEVA